MPVGHEFSEKNTPLSPSERARIIETAMDSRFPVKLSTLYLLFSGMKPHWASHVSSDMVDETPQGLKIVLPPGKHQCMIGGHGGPHNDWGKNRASCSFCENGIFEFTTPRAIPIRNERAVTTIRQWFKLYDFLPSVSTTRNYVSDVGERAGIPRTSPVVLRHSFGVMLAGKGFSRREIAKVMGFSKSSVEGSSYVFFTYGRLCEGPNPFVCGAETVDGDRCQQPVKEIGKNRCRHHREEQCGAETKYRDRCKKPPTQPDGRCSFHTEVE